MISFREAYNKFRNKVGYKYLKVLGFMIFGAIAIYAMQMTKDFKIQKQEVEDSNNKALYQIVGYMQTVQTELAKLQIVSTTPLTSSTLASIWKQSNLAKENLESLPVNQESLKNASKYLSQVSDFSYTLMKQVISGNKITDEEYKQIEDIYQDSKELSSVLESVYDDLNSNKLNWDELKTEGEEKLESTQIAQEVSNFGKISKTFTDYEGLIYDGAFSDHLLTSTPKNLSDKETSKEEAQKFITNIFGKDNIVALEDSGETSGIIDLYNFNVKLKNRENVINMSITKKDCKLYLMLSDKNVTEEKIDMDTAKEMANNFLKEKLNITNMKDTYYLKNDNMATINFAATQDDVILYPDLIKVKIALDDGEILSVESQGYIFNNTKRENIMPKITLEEAKSILNKNLNIISSGMAIIPTDSKNEVLTYEFKGKIDEREFLIYVNANEKKEEKVLLILETPGGILTM